MSKTDVPGDASGDGSMHPLRCILVGLLAGLGALAIGGCDDLPSNSAETTRDTPGPYTRPEAVDCSKADQIRRRSGRRVVEGRVSVPVFERGAIEDASAAESDGSPSLDASGPPPSEERPAREVSVVWYRRARPDSLLVETTTNLQGEWCVALPDGFELGVEIVAEARFDDRMLRRSVVTPFNQVISVRSEALARVLESRSQVRPEMARATYLNLLSMASTAVDLLEPVRWGRETHSIEDVVRRMGSTLERDRRVQTLFERLTATRTDTSDVGTQPKGEGDAG